MGINGNSLLPLPRSIEECQALAVEASSAELYEACREITWKSSRSDAIATAALMLFGKTLEARFHRRLDDQPILSPEEITNWTRWLGGEEYFNALINAHDRGQR